MSSLNQELSAAKQLVEHIRETWPDEDEAFLTDNVESETDLLEICSWLVYRVGVDEKSIEANKAYQKDLGERCDRLAKRVESTKTRLKGVMDGLGLKKLELDCATLSMRTNQPKLVITDETKLPHEYWKIPEPVPDKTLIKKALDNGDVPGAELDNAEPSLATRRK